MRGRRHPGSLVLMLAFTPFVALPAQDGANRDPVWSPDGRLIAFGSNRHGDDELYVMNADGTGVRRVTSHPGRDAHPAWSPDGSRIAFQSPRAGGEPQLWVMNADGSDPRPLTDNAGFTGVPAWSPDGRQLAFQVRVAEADTARWQLFVINADGTGQRRLSASAADDQVPKWSPDGTTILFHSNETGREQLHLIAPDGSGRRRLAEHEGNSGSANWSRDGRHIVFTNERGGVRALCRMTARGDGMERLHEPVWFGAPSLAPDGSRVLFVAQTPHGQQIFLLAVADGRVEPLTGPRQAPARGTGATNPPRIRALRAAVSPRIDGRLDDAAWTNASFASGFVQRDPAEGQPASAPTEVAVVLTAEALVIGARLRSAARGDVRALVTRRDHEGSADQFVVSLDPYRDRRTAYSFGVTAAGGQMDYFHPTDDRQSRDYSFDPVWEAAARVDSSGWTVEMRIPLAQLRFNAAPLAVWGINFARLLPARNEEAYWSHIPKNEVGWSSRFGELHGLDDLRAPRRIELLPYLSGSSTSLGGRAEDHPFPARSAASRVGADLRVGIGPNLTAEATINPDFGQVEADPAIVNLTVFDVQLQERRPFFVEGNQLLRGSGATYFYSRRIGAPPRPLVSADYVDVPASTDIIGAAKVTGRLRSGLSIGALAAVTGDESIRTYHSATSALAEARAQPVTTYGVARVLQEFGDGSTAGFIFTGVRRALGAEPTLRAAFNANAIAGGVDWNLRFRRGEYTLSGDAGFSRIAGDSTAILAAQRSSARYFQRPDADHLRLDPSRTSLAGFRGRLAFARNSGTHWLWNVSLATQSPGFELNDVGRSTAVDEISASGQLRFRETRPTRVLRSYSLSAFLNASWNCDGMFQGNELPGLFGEFQFLNFWEGTLHYHYRARVLDPRLTRGGPAMAAPANHHVAASLGGNRAARFTWEARVDHLPDDLGGSETEVTAAVGYRPRDRWQVTFEPSWRAGVNPRQYVAERPGRPETFGTRYVFGALDRRELATRMRLNYFVSPRLSLEGWVEAFASRGRYDRLGELRRPRGLDLRLYGTDGSTITRTPQGYSVTDGADQLTFTSPDFDVRSLRSNTVLRWEWRAGSTIYLVWQQNRGSSRLIERDVGIRSLFDSFGEPSDNVLAVKVSYWLPIG